jgi:hypothetical protein
MSPLRGEHVSKPTYRILDRLGDGRGDDVFLTHHEIFNAVQVGAGSVGGAMDGGRIASQPPSGLWPVPSGAAPGRTHGGFS